MKRSPVVAAVTAVLLLAACGTAQPAPAPASTSTSAAPARTVQVRYAGGQVSGDTGKVAVPVGSVVDLVVSSDVADEVHLHGYDRSVEVPAGGTATLRFTADVPGGFEVELEKLSRQLVELQVS